MFVGSIGYFLLKTILKIPSDFSMKCLMTALKEKLFIVMGVDVKDVKNIENGTRSDTMMIVSIDTGTGKTDIISVPRDTYAKIEGHGRQKLNHSFNFGGPELTLKTINDTLGTDIKNYVVVDYGFVKKVTDIVDGVEVDVPMDMKYNDEYSDPPLHIDLKRGVQTFKWRRGYTVLRFRKGYVNQDLGRVEAQQQFAGAFCRS